MNQKTFSLVAGTIFLIIGVLHVARIIFGWEAVIGGWQVPMQLSWVAAVAGLYLGFQGVRYGK
ncbi:MAG: hypothetical protein HYU04_01210 [Candidatus Wildermuthbacteria bacterium]|nr:hypothetical protein [Candidatus Wildermuthbacteria bacterium]